MGRVMKAIQIRRAFLITTFGLGVAWFLFRSNQEDEGPFPSPCHSVTESQNSGRFVKGVTITPRSIAYDDCEIQIQDAWIERAIRKKGSFIRRDEPLGYWFLCLTLKNGDACFAKISNLKFVLENRACSFASVNMSELFYSEIEAIEPGQLKICLVSTWGEKCKIFVTAQFE